jgi:hypothetical protein
MTIIATRRSTTGMFLPTRIWGTRTAGRAGERSETNLGHSALGPDRQFALIILGIGMEQSPS